MGELIDLKGYRTQKKRSYNKKYELHISKFVSRFIASHVPSDLETLQNTYLAGRCSEQTQAWDYTDFRETLKEAIDLVFGQQLWDECQRNYWCDARYLSRDELLERFVSQLVLGKPARVMP